MTVLDMCSEKVTFLRTYYLQPCMEKEKEVDQRQGIVITFENLVEIRALLIYIN